jgi:hypothetical protein
MVESLDRRNMCVGLGALAVSAGGASAQGLQQVSFDTSKPTEGVKIPESKVAEIAAAPTITKTVNKLFNNQPTIKEPNAMQFTKDGKLLVLDQVDPNKIFELSLDGKILRTVQTEAMHGSGITVGDGGAWWITSTKGINGSPPVTLKIDPATGKTLKRWVTPGWGYYGGVTKERGSPSGGHDVKWAGNGKYWLAVPASGRIFLMEGETGQVVRSIPAPVLRTHGLAIDGDYLWSVGSDFWQIHKVDTKDGKVVQKIQLTKGTDPAIHGLEMRNGVIWYNDAQSGWTLNLT